MASWRGQQNNPDDWKPAPRAHPVYLAVCVEVWKAGYDVRESHGELLLAKWRNKGGVMQLAVLARWPLATVTADEVRATLREARLSEVA